MIICLNNNFGVAPANIQLKDYQSQDIIVLQGMFSVDTTDEDYLAAGVLRITMPNFASETATNRRCSPSTGTTEPTTLHWPRPGSRRATSCALCR